MLRTDAFRKIRLTRLDRAYLDVRTLLSQQGSCSEFFGRGPAQDVLEELVIKLQEERLSDSSVGIRVSGNTRTQLITVSFLLSLRKTRL